MLHVDAVSAYHSFSCRALLGVHVHLRSSALLALTKLMAIDPSFCDANLALVFTLLEKRSALSHVPLLLS